MRGNLTLLEDCSLDGPCPGRPKAAARSAVLRILDSVRPGRHATDKVSFPRCVSVLCKELGRSGEVDLGGYARGDCTAALASRLQWWRA